MSGRSGAILQCLSGLLLVLGLTFGRELRAADPEVLAAQQARSDVISRISPSVVAIFPPGGGGGGSGVLVTADGYALSNFHVTGEGGPYLKCGLNDGELYDAVVVGHDPTGDVSLIKLVGRTDFPFAKLGDSDQVRVGDWTYVLGNPFLLATDFQPTVTYGIVSGVQRYQYPAAKFLLEYTDCIQVDTSINPGNSGGPLFNAQGELIGINGRGSFEKRGRVNSGAGYAISINQIKHFWDHLRSGRIVDHGTLGATLNFNGDRDVVVDQILESSDAYRAGLRENDEVVSFAGRLIDSPNQFKNVLGIYPQGRKVALVYRRDGERREIWVRLSALHLQEDLLPKEEGPQQPKEKRPRGQKPMPKPAPDDQQPQPPNPDEDQKPDEILPDGAPQGPAENPHQAAAPVPEHLKAQFAKQRGFANYYFNQVEQLRVQPAFDELGRIPVDSGPWKWSGKVDGKDPFSLTIGQQGIGVDLGQEVYLQEFGELQEIRDEPPGTGGLLGAWRHWRLLQTSGPAGFTEWYYEGSEPLDGRGERVDIIQASFEGARSYWFVTRDKPRLIGFDYERYPDAGRCEIRIADWRPVSSGKVPAKFTVSFPGQASHTWTVEQASVGAAK